MVQSQVYSIVLNEMDWYGKPEEYRRELEQDTLRDAASRGAKYACILVQPDDLLSVSPVPHRHAVWQHMFRDIEKERRQFEHDLRDAYGQSRLELHEKQAIARKVFDL